MFRIGEFSKITMTAITQLRYYDEIGLFQPEYTDQFTGYRYYSMAQVPKLHRILALKELGLSLDQIQRLVADEISVEELRGMLVLKKAQVEQDVRAEIMRLRNIEIHLQQMADDGKVPQDGITLKRLPTTAFLGSRRIFPRLSDGAASIIETSQLVPRKVPKTYLGHFTVLFHGDGFDIENADIELGFLLNDAVSTPVSFDHNDELSTSLLPEVASAACALHVGPLDTIIETYARVGRWIELNHYTLAGPVREVFITLPQPDARSETVCEIQIPVEVKPSKRLEPQAHDITEHHDNHARHPTGRKQQHCSGGKNTMTTPRAAIKRTFRVTVDIEATVQAMPHEELCSQPAHIRYHQALVQQLQAHPAQRNHLLRAAATTAMKQAMQLLIAEYGWGSVSDQQLLQPLVVTLEPAAQSYFKEEVEDGASVYYFDGYDATVLRVDMTELD